MTTFGSSGNGPQRLLNPSGIAVSPDGQTVWVADQNNNRISIWTKSGSTWSNLTTFGSSGSGLDNLDHPAAVEVSADGQTVWVADSSNNRISVWTKSGSSWSNLTTFGSSGGGVNNFITPIGVAVASDEQTVWVADVGNSRISVWTKSGSTWSNETTFGSDGGGPSNLGHPVGVAVSSDGQTAWVADTNNFRVSIWQFGACPAG